MAENTRLPASGGEMMKEKTQRPGLSFVYFVVNALLLRASVISVVTNLHAKAGL